MVVSGDLFFLINFSMDFLCFYLSCLLLHRKMNTLRVLLASAIGGAYSVASLFFSVGRGTALVLDLIILIFMCVVAYGTKKVKFFSFFKSVLLYFFVSALLGGLMTALFSLFNNLSVLDSSKIGSEGVDVWIFALLAVISALISIRGGRFYRGSTTRRRAEIEISSQGGVVHLSALVDSGNLAYEPISGKAVVFANIDACREIIDEKTYKALKSESDITALPLEVASKIRLIPSKMIGGGAILPALKFTSVCATSGKQKKELDVYVALLNDEIAGGFDAIISDEALL